MMYPEIAAYSTEFLRVSELHTLYVEESGNPQGIPVVVLHGGPGGGSSPVQRRFFDPSFYRIILFDQRGAGKSAPRGETRENTVADLVADLERIRKHLDIEKWLVFGGSWGSTLAMAYGVVHPDHCLGFILRGVFLMSPSEIAWFLVGTRQFYPELWAPLMLKLLKACGKTHENLDTLAYIDILNLLETLLHSGQSDLADEVFQAFGQFEQDLMTLLPQDRFEATAEHCKTVAKIEQHFFKHNYPETAHLLEQLVKVKHLPCTIVQGRYDVVCPPITAYKVHQIWQGSKLVMVPNGGHSAMDPAIAEALVQATDEFKEIIAY